MIFNFSQDDFPMEVEQVLQEDEMKAKIHSIYNEMRKAIHMINLAIYYKHESQRKLIRIQEQLYRDIQSIESSALCEGGPLSLHLFRTFDLKENYKRLPNAS